MQNDPAVKDRKESLQRNEHDAKRVLGTGAATIAGGVGGYSIAEYLEASPSLRLLAAIAGAGLAGTGTYMAIGDYKKA